jgi:hypothetical protein
VKEYSAVLLSADITAGDSCYEYDFGKTDQLTVWESENLHLGQKYIRFRTEDDLSEIQTSCGDITIVNDVFEICTQADGIT